MKIYHLELANMVKYYNELNNFESQDLYEKFEK